MNSGILNRLFSVFVFNVPPTAKVIWRRVHCLKSHADLSAELQKKLLFLHYIKVACWYHIICNILKLHAVSRGEGCYYVAQTSGTKHCYTLKCDSYQIRKQ